MNNVYTEFRRTLLSLITELSKRGELPGDFEVSRISVEPPRDVSHGDFTTNAALILAKQTGQPPRVLADQLVSSLKALPDLLCIEIAGPGFINWRMEPRFWQRQLPVILRAGMDYGNSHQGGGGLINVEYVSANPTGPLHLAHARGAIVGDVLCNLLEKAGFRVVREYYINDAGGQVDILARSTFLRYREALGEEIGEIPEGYYPGDYLKDIGAALAKRDGDRWLLAPESEWLDPLRRFATSFLLEDIRADLETLGVRHDVFTSERELVWQGGVDRALQSLEEKGLIYEGVLEPPKGKSIEDWEPRPQTLFRATAFGDDVDRPLKKSDGSWTYFAADIANHYDKFQRGAGTLIDVWGADHGGYIKRMQAAVAALTGGEAVLDVKICQLVRLLRRGEPVRMSKRRGQFITLREVIDEVGRDVIRFIMLTRKNDAALDFDLAKVVEQSRDNPVYYVHYAHARACSVIRHAEQNFPGLKTDPESLARVDLSCLQDEAELAVMKALANWPRTIEGAAESHEPHRIAFYLQELAASFHTLWNKGHDRADLRFLVPDQPDVSAARLALVKSVSLVIASGLKLVGVEPLEELR